MPAWNTILIEARGTAAAGAGAEPGETGTPYLLIETATAQKPVAPVEGVPLPSV